MELSEIAKARIIAIFRAFTIGLFVGISVKIFRLLQTTDVALYKLSGYATILWLMVDAIGSAVITVQ